MPWPRKSKVHMSTFHAGPVRRSCIVKFSGPDAGGRVVSSAPDTCNLSSWLPSYLRAQGRVGTERLRKILSPTPGTHGGLRIPQLHVTLLAPLLNLPAHTSFLPFVSLYVCPAQMLLSSQKCFPTVPSSRIPLCCLCMLPPSQLPSPLPRHLSQTALCLPPRGMHTTFCLGYMASPISLESPRLFPRDVSTRAYRGQAHLQRQGRATA